MQHTAVRGRCVCASGRELGSVKTGGPVKSHFVRSAFVYWLWLVDFSLSVQFVLQPVKGFRIGREWTPLRGSGMSLGHVLQRLESQITCIWCWERLVLSRSCWKPQIDLSISSLYPIINVEAAPKLNASTPSSSVTIWHFLVKLFFSCAAIRQEAFSLCWWS